MDAGTGGTVAASGSHPMAVLWDHTRQRVGSHRSCIETPSVLCLVVQMRRPEHTTPGSCLKKCEACPACRVCRACSRAVHGLNWLQNLHPVTYMHPCGLSARPSVRIAEHLTGLMSTCQTAEHYPHPSINAQHALPQWRHKFCGTTVLCSVAHKCPAESRRSRAGAMRGSPWQAALGLTWRSCPALFQYGTSKCRQGLA